MPPLQFGHSRSLGLCRTSGNGLNIYQFTLDANQYRTDSIEFAENYDRIDVSQRANSKFAIALRIVCRVIDLRITQCYSFQTPP